MILILLYWIAILIANLTVAQFGASAAVINAFVLIGLDLTVRDSLHERWHGKYLWRNMFLLIGIGSIVSAALNRNAVSIAIASFFAFSATGLSDTITYELMGDRSILIKMNGSNLISAAVDSAVFILLAFVILSPDPMPLPIALNLILLQYVAKIAGGFIWSLVIQKLQVR